MSHPQISTKAVRVHCCHCNGYYLIPYSPNRVVLSHYLAYSVCDICDTPRSPELWQDDTRHCVICHLPLEKQGSSLIYCENHYMQYYRERKKFRILLNELLSQARDFLEL